MNHPSASVLSAVPISDSARRGSPAVVSEFGEPHVSYVICTNPRSGSWLLAEGLESTGVAGHPREWFHEAAAQALCHKAGLPATAGAGDSRFLAAVKLAAQTANGVFGLKLHYYQFEEVQTKLRLLPGCAELSRPRRFEAAFGKVQYLWLTRRDKARQAVSYHRACQTDGWWQKEGQEPPRRPGAVAVAAFDAHAIEQLENLLLANEQGWQRYFDEAKAAPLVVHYEDLAGDYEGEIRRVLAWLGVPNAAGVAVPPPTLKKQADATTDEWVERYLRFKGASGSSRVGIAHHAGQRRSVVQAATPGEPAGAIAVVDGDGGQYTPYSAITDDWKRWIGENKLQGASDESIIDVLTKNGFDRTEATAEVARAAANPYLAAGDWYVQRLKKAYSLLEGLMDDWPAMRRWTPDYLKELLCDEEVEIMAERAGDANYEINCQDHRRKMPFRQYVDLVHSGERTNDYYLVANNGCLRRPKPRRLLADMVMFEEYLDPSIATRPIWRVGRSLPRLRCAR